LPWLLLLLVCAAVCSSDAKQSAPTWKHESKVCAVNAVDAAAGVQAEAGGAPERLTLLHRKAEDTHLPDSSFDVVSMCLVAHELPQHATKAILREAYRCAWLHCVSVCVTAASLGILPAVG
jgi:ubiquinone/menaquinone biosynthesis C-methylase UbiE